MPSQNWSVVQNLEMRFSGASNIPLRGALLLDFQQVEGDRAGEISLLGCDLRPPVWVPLISIFETVRHLQCRAKKDIMPTNFTSKPQHRVDPPDHADDGRRGPRTSDTIFRRLSRLDLGIAPDPNSTRNSPRSEGSTEKEEPGQLRTRTWFVVLDNSGPLADFPTWEDAYRYVTTNDVAACIIRVEEPLEPADGGG